MSTTHEITRKYRENLSAFADFLKQIIEICIEEEVTTLSAAVVDGFKELLNKVDIDDTISKFILISFVCNNSKPFLVWDQVSARDEKHLLSNLSNLIEEEYRPKIQPYLHLLNAVDSDGDLIVDDDYRNVLWAYCESFISLAVKYLHLKRGPKQKEEDDGSVKKTYTKSYHPRISPKHIQKYAKKFNVELTW